MPGTPPMLLIRADAGSRIGTGHVMRCLALAQAWADDGGRAAFACAEIPPALSVRLEGEGFPVHAITAPLGSVADAEQTVRLASAVSAETANSASSAGSASSLIPHPSSLPPAEGARVGERGVESGDPPPPSSFPTWVVADGYHFDLPFQRALRATGTKLLLIDDYGSLSGYEADLLLNQNIDADAYGYPAIPAASRLLGLRYALLRREFVAAGAPDRETPPVACRVLVTLGGGDPDNATTRVAGALRSIEDQDLRVRVLAGPAFPHRAALETAVDGDPRFEILSFTGDMPAHMRWADLAVSAGGSTCWELLRMGVPFFALVLAENQRGIAKRLDEARVAVNLGWHSDWSDDAFLRAFQRLRDNAALRQNMSRAGWRIADGRGAERVRLRLQECST